VFVSGAKVFYWVYDISTLSLGVILASVLVGFSWFGSIFVRPWLVRWVPIQPGQNEFMGAILSCFGVFYGLLLGLVAVGVWENYADVDGITVREAAALDALVHDIATYPEPFGQNLKWLLREYCRHEVKVAWPLQKQGQVSEGGNTRVMAFQEKLLSFQPKTIAQQVIHAETLRQFNVFLEQRRLRLNAVSTGLPAVMWNVVMIGTVINIALVWLFDMKLSSHLFLGGLLSFFLSMMILLIVTLDNPFRGEIGVSSDPLESVHQVLMRD